MDAVNLTLFFQREETRKKGDPCCEFPKQTHIHKKKKERKAWRVDDSLRCPKKETRPPCAGPFFPFVSFFASRLCGPGHCCLQEILTQRQPMTNWQIPTRGRKKKREAGSIRGGLVSGTSPVDAVFARGQTPDAERRAHTPDVFQTAKKGGKKAHAQTHRETRGGKKKREKEKTRARN